MMQFLSGAWRAANKRLGMVDERLRRRIQSNRPTLRLAVETLEDRCVPAALYATSFFDSALYQFDSTSGALQKILVTPYTASLLSGPAGLATGPDGNLYISSQFNNAILEYNLTTNALTTFIPTSVLAPIATTLGAPSFSPAGLRFGADGKLYVALNGGQTSTVGAVERFDITSGANGLSAPGTFTQIASTGLVQPAGLAFGTSTGDTNNLYVSNSGGGTVVKITGATTASPTNAIFVAAGSGPAATPLNFPAGLTFGPAGKLYVVDLGATSNQGNILRYNADGSFDKVFNQVNAGNQGSLQFQFPSDALFDTQGNLLTANLGPARPPNLLGSIFQYDSTGTFSKTLVSSSQFPNTGTGTSGFAPSQLALIDPPAFTSAGSATFTVGSASNFPVTATGAPKPTVTETGSLPSGVTFNPATGALTGTPAAGTTGTYSDTFTATSSAGTATQAFTLTVNPALAITSAGSATFTVGSSSSFTVTTTGVPTPTLTQTGTLPGGVTFNPANGLLSGTPINGTAGTFSDTFTATNSNGFVTQTFTLTVLNKPSNFDKLGAYRSSDGSFSLDSDGTFGFNPASDQVFLHFGSANLTGVAGDWQGTGRTNIGDFSGGLWHIDLNNNGTADSGETFNFGQAGDKPVVGDWTGDGKSKLGVFRTAPDGVTGEFILDSNNNRQMDSGDATFTFGRATDRIVVGDWTGDHITKVGVFRDAATFIPADAGNAVFTLDVNNDHNFSSADQIFVYGLFSDGVVIGDWNGNGISKVGTYRDGSKGFNAAGTGLFSLDVNGDRQFETGTDSVFLYGLTTDQFLAGNWNVTPPLVPSGAASGDRFAASLTHTVFTSPALTTSDLGLLNLG